MTITAIEPRGKLIKYIGLSTDTKPTIALHTGLPVPSIGSTMIEYDKGHTYITYDGTNWSLKNIATGGILKEVRVSQVIDGSLGAYTAGDVVGADDCCTTLAVVWTFDVARVSGGYGYIVGASLVNETENQAVQYDLLLFNATPTGELRDNAANDNPLKGDRSKFIGVVEFPLSVAKGTTVATYTEATPSTPGRLPKAFKCAAGTTSILGVLVTNTAYTQSATDDIEITLLIEQL